MGFQIGVCRLSLRGFLFGMAFSWFAKIKGEDAGNEGFDGLNLPGLGFSLGAAGVNSPRDGEG